MISVHEAEKLSLKGIAAFLHASEEIHFLGENRPQVYAWMETVLRQQQYVQQGRRARGLQREYQQYGKPEYERLASISVAHLYNLRRQQRYRERRLTYDKTKPTRV